MKTSGKVMEIRLQAPQDSLNISQHVSISRGSTVLFGHLPNTFRCLRDRFQDALGIFISLFREKQGIPVPKLRIYFLIIFKSNKALEN
jgi:hypothetical protein